MPSCPPKSKPWDNLRITPPIGNGAWATDRCGATVNVSAVAWDGCTIEIRGQAFEAEDLRQLAEFVTELADQIEGK